MKKKNRYSKLKKRGLSLALALAIVLGNAPLSIQAQDGAAEVEALAKEQSVVKTEKVDDQKSEDQTLKKAKDDKKAEEAGKTEASEKTEKDEAGNDSDTKEKDLESKEEPSTTENTSETDKKESGNANASENIAKADENTASDENISAADSTNTDADPNAAEIVNAAETANTAEAAASVASEEQIATVSEEEAQDAKEEEEQKESEDLLKLLSASGVSDTGASSVDDSVKFVPGKYTISANLYVPKEKNKVLSNINAFMTNPDNPLGIKDENDSCNTSIPSKPVTGNATIVIGEDGTTKTLTVPVKNPVFTLQSIGSGNDVTLLDKKKNSTVYANSDGSVSRKGRITSITVSLKNNSGSYEFSNCEEFPTLLGQTWTVPLSLSVDMASIPQQKSDDGTKEDQDAPVMLEGDGSVWDKASSESLLFRSSADFKTFIKVTVDGNTVDEANFDAYSGSTIIELHAEYLKTLTTGEHTIAICSQSGITSANFTVTGQQNTDRLAPGTYKITANVFLPGELNTELPGTTAYMTNPANPLGIGGHTGIPMTPVSDNAVLVVGMDGTMTVAVDVVNPVFTLQKVTGGENTRVLSTVRDSEVYAGVSGTVSRNGRITKLYVALNDMSGLYKFGDCVEFPTLLETDWKVSMQMSVDFDSAMKTSEETTMDIPGSQNNSTDNGSADSNTADTKQDTADGKNTDIEDAETEDTDASSGTGLKAGIYTVAANIWINKASAGLPLSPHLTNSAFPPKDPVKNNAKVTIDKNGNAEVVVPIVIPSKAMSVKSIHGLDIVKSSKSGGYLTSITVNLGKVKNAKAVITKKCTVSLDLGSLAQTIAHKGQSQVWDATFQVSFSGIPSAKSGGGTVDVNALVSQAEDEEVQTVTTHVGVLAEKETAVLASMMNEHKDDEKKSQTKNAAKDTKTAAENYYIFTVSKLTDEEKTQLEQLEGDEKTAKEAELNEKLKEEYLKAFVDEKYDVILAEEKETEALLENKDFSFCIAGQINYTDKNDQTTKRLVLVRKSFADENEAVMQELLTKLETSVKNAAEKAEEASVYAVTFGIGESAGDVKSYLTENTLELLQGEEVKAASSELTKALQAPELYYVAKTTDKTIASEIEESNTEEKTAITDAESLSSALDAALAKKTDDSVANSQGLDQEKEEAAAKELAPGTYTVSANMYLPGELNTQLPGTTAYMTNPDNPLGIGGHDGIPMTPVSDNATLVVGEDGTKTIEIEIVNPVFTLQNIAKPRNSKILAGVKDTERYEGTNGVGVDGRITKLYIQLDDDTAVYAFDDCHEFPTLLEADWYVQLEMSVEFTTAKKVSDETALELPEDSAAVASK